MYDNVVNPGCHNKLPFEDVFNPSHLFHLCWWLGKFIIGFTTLCSFLSTFHPINYAQKVQRCSQLLFLRDDVMRLLSCQCQCIGWRENLYTGNQWFFPMKYNGEISIIYSKWAIYPHFSSPITSQFWDHYHGLRAPLSKWSYTPVIYTYTIVYIYIYMGPGVSWNGGTSTMGYPKMDGLEWKIQLKWMI